MQEKNSTIDVTFGSDGQVKSMTMTNGLFFKRDSEVFDAARGSYTKRIVSPAVNKKKATAFLQDVIRRAGLTADVKSFTPRTNKNHDHVAYKIKEFGGVYSLGTFSDWSDIKYAYPKRKPKDEEKVESFKLFLTSSKLKRSTYYSYPRTRYTKVLDHKIIHEFSSMEDIVNNLELILNQHRGHNFKLEGAGQKVG